MQYRTEVNKRLIELVNIARDLQVKIKTIDNKFCENVDLYGDDAENNVDKLEQLIERWCLYLNNISITSELLSEIVPTHVIDRTHVTYYFIRIKNNQPSTDTIDLEMVSKNAKLEKFNAAQAYDTIWSIASISERSINTAEGDPHVSLVMLSQNLYEKTYRFHANACIVSPYINNIIKNNKYYIPSVKDDKKRIHKSGDLGGIEIYCDILLPDSSDVLLFIKGKPMDCGAQVILYGDKNNMKEVYNTNIGKLCTDEFSPNYFLKIHVI